MDRCYTIVADRGFYPKQLTISYIVNVFSIRLYQGGSFFVNKLQKKF